MKIIKRNGNIENVDINKIVIRLQRLILGEGINQNDIIGKKLNIDPVYVASKVCGKLENLMTTDKLDNYTAELCQFMIGENYEYGLLANRLIISGHHRNTKQYSNFSDVTEKLYLDNKLNKNYYDFVMKHANELNSMINNNNDYKILNYVSLKTLIKNYFLTTNDKKCIERYQHLLLRQCVTIHMNSFNNDDICLSEIKKSYEFMSNGYFTHASPTMYNSGTKKQQMSSCFLLHSDDSTFSMYETLKNISDISRSAGGVGLKC
jgi:ribonucleotide reductase alpha subunit